MPGGEVDSVAAVLGRLQRCPGDTEAWGSLFRQTWPYVLGLSHSFLGRTARLSDAEDVAQEVFLLLARALHEDRLKWPADEDELRSLLLVMSRNQSRDAQRREHRRQRDVRRQVELVEEGLPASRTPSPGTALETKEWLDHLLGRLSPFDQVVLRMLLSGHAPADIAREMGTSLKTVQRHQRLIRSLVAADEHSP